MSSLSISSETLNFSGKTNEVICRSVPVSFNDKIIIEDRWNSKETKNLNDYRFNASYFGLNLLYPQVSSNKIIDFCIVGNHPGKYYGALLFKEEESITGVGIWASIDIRSNESFTSLISGKVIGEGFENNSINILLFIIFILLVIVLYKLLYGHKRNTAQILRIE